MTLTFADSISRVVCLGAHPDDIEIGALGAILTIAARYPDATFTFVVLTAEGGRAAEANASAHALLGDRCTVHTGDFADNLLPYVEPARVKSFLRDSIPAAADIVFTPRRADRHQDHRFAADLAGQVLRSGLVLQYEIINNDRDLGQPNAFVSLTASVVEAKVEHLMGHFPSQQTKDWYAADVFRSLARVRGFQSGAAEGYAEGFVADGLSIGIGS